MTENKVLKNIYVHESKWEKAMRVAKSMGLSTSAWVRMLINKELKRADKRSDENK